MSDWRNCIVILIDLIGIKKLATKGDSRASSLMREFHRLIHQEMNAGLSSLSHAYAWNDAVLLLAYVDGEARMVERSIIDAVRLKDRVDLIRHSYAIAVMGKSFPTNSGSSRDDRRVTVLGTSSYAMANCFEIEKEIKSQELKMAWYIDERIAKKLPVPKQASIRVALLPDRKHRKIYMYPTSASVVNPSV